MFSLGAYFVCSLADNERLEPNWNNFPLFWEFFGQRSGIFKFFLVWESAFNGYFIKKEIVVSTAILQKWTYLSIEVYGGEGYFETAQPFLLNPLMDHATTLPVILKQRQHRESVNLIYATLNCRGNTLIHLPQSNNCVTIEPCSWKTGLNARV